MPKKPFSIRWSGKRLHLPERRSPGESRGPEVIPAFAKILEPLVPLFSGPVSEFTLQGAPLVHLDYMTELQVKRNALARFWCDHHLPGEPEGIVASPRHRGYRTTSKRKTMLRGDTLCLFFGEGQEHSGPAFRPSELEPPEHAQLYHFLQEKLSQPSFRMVARHLNYLVIRGSYAERAVIFNVHRLNSSLVRKLKIMGDHLRNQPAPAVAAFIYNDPSRSDYYLESRRPDDALQMKKLFGPRYLAVKFGGCHYRFHPTSFSQVNESMAPVMLCLARDLLHPESNESLLDLYCGYGLFSHFLAPDYRKVVGVDVEGPAIRAASDNSYLNNRGGYTSFLARPITGNFIEQLRPAGTAREAVLLDPPRQGPQIGVVKALGQRRPQSVLHIFCGIDQIPAALADWRVNGYDVERVVPLDMFPGTAHLEILVLLKRRTHGRAHVRGWRS